MDSKADVKGLVLQSPQLSNIDIVVEIYQETDKLYQREHSLLIYQDSSFGIEETTGPRHLKNFAGEFLKVTSIVRFKCHGYKFLQFIKLKLGPKSKI